MTLPENLPQTSILPSPYNKKDSSLAIISLVSGLVGWTFVPVIGAITAIITGHLAKKEIRASGGMLAGDGMALAGLILGYAQIGILVLAAICLFTGLVALFPSIQSGINNITSYLPSAL
ncbi:MAG: DUF4190 domain-containing protein [Chloroflexi bacterium]|nr:DUF4190 domain-containing protein [Chloroflexota bacterium]